MNSYGKAVCVMTHTRVVLYVGAGGSRALYEHIDVPLGADVSLFADRALEALRRILARAVQYGGLHQSLHLLVGEPWLHAVLGQAEHRRPEVFEVRPDVLALLDQEAQSRSKKQLSIDPAIGEPRDWTRVGYRRIATMVNGYQTSQPTGQSAHRCSVQALSCFVRTRWYEQLQNLAHIMLGVQDIQIDGVGDMLHHASSMVVIIDALTTTVRTYQDSRCVATRLVPAGWQSILERIDDRHGHGESELLYDMAHRAMRQHEESYLLGAAFDEAHSQWRMLLHQTIHDDIYDHPEIQTCHLYGTDALAAGLTKYLEVYLRETVGRSIPVYDHTAERFGELAHKSLRENL